jgi:membrane protein YdbS with pleckstrin-like domain
MFREHTLMTYVVAVVIVMAVLIGIRWLLVGYQGAEKTLVFCIGFLFGMIAMYIAMHVYRDDIWQWLSSR